MNTEPKEKKCEAQNHQDKRRKKAGQTILDLLCAPGVLAMTIATRKDRRYHQEKAKDPE